MPALSPSDLVDSVLTAIRLSGGSGVYTSHSVQEHPRKFMFHLSDRTYSLWVYIWTITHGGRVSLPDEYRIQMTSVTSPLSLNPRGFTVLLGFFPELGVLGGFDVQMHRIFSTGSPSVQIQKQALEESQEQGLAFSVKENLEIAIGIRPDQFLNYVFNAEELHQHGLDLQTRDLLTRSFRDVEIGPEDIEDLPTERKRVVAQVSRYLTLMLQKKPLKCVFEFTPVSVRRRGNASDRFQPWDWD